MGKLHHPVSEPAPEPELLIRLSTEGKDTPGEQSHAAAPPAQMAFVSFIKGQRTKSLTHIKKMNQTPKPKPSPQTFRRAQFSPHCSPGCPGAAGAVMELGKGGKD